jgi:hypothetical protein
MDRTIRAFEAEESQRHDRDLEARQGETSGHMRRVLISSLMLALVAGAVLLTILG